MKINHSPAAVRKDEILLSSPLLQKNGVGRLEKSRLISKSEDLAEKLESK